MGKMNSLKVKDPGHDTKVAAPAGKPSIGAGISQKITGKLKGMEAMPGGGDAGKGGPVKTVPSNPIAGKTKSSGQAMPNGVKPGLV